MTIEEIKALIRMTGEAGLAQLKVEKEGFSLRIRAGSNAPAASSASTAASTPVIATEIVRAPLSGVFYIAPAPGEPPFVAVGDSFSAGDTLGIVEAMKTLNQVVAPAAGKILASRAEDGDMVDLEQPLFEVAWAK